MDEAVSTPSRRDGSLSAPSLLIVLGMLRRFKGRDPDRPQIVSHNPRSDAVLERANQLARQGREDAGAVADLTALARGRRRTLRQAEKASRFMGYHRELRVPNLTNRLLKAAVAREQTPQALTAHEDERIAAIEMFHELGKDEQWPFLIAAEPALGRLAADVDSGRFGELRMPPELSKTGVRTPVIVEGRRMERVTLSSSDPPYAPEEIQLLRKLSREQMRLTTELQSLVGPLSGQRDLVLVSQNAFDAADRHLRRHPTEPGLSEVPLT
jgi:hypothetical protein